jgi:D-alanyl-D-alanine dipeptidase
MGTAFDHAGPLAQPRLERTFLLRGKLGPSQLANRLLLRHVMVQAGFVPLDIEWWHFDCMSPRRARGTLRIVQ